MNLTAKRIDLRSLISVLSIMVFSMTTFAQDKINWISWEQAVEKQKAQPKKIMVDLYTDWCGWCKKLDKKTFGDKTVAQYVNENYYAVKFDAEQKKEITFKGKEYKFVKGGRRGYHMLAAELTRGKLSYPTTVFLDETASVIQPIQGFFGPSDFMMILSYFGQNHYKSTPWKTYSIKYKEEKKTFAPTKTVNSTLVGNRN